MLDGFSQESMRAFKGWLGQVKGEESMLEWGWRSENGVKHQLGDLEEEE